MADSDDIVLILEYDGNAAANDAVIVASNAAFRRASGFSDDQLLGRAAADLFPRKEHAEVLMKAIHDNGSLRSELACSQANGNTFMLGMHLMPAPAQTPGKACFVILGRDVTATLEAAQMQDAIQHLLAKVFSSVDAAVLIISGAGRIVMTNRACDLLLGYAPNAMVGRISIEMVACASRARVAAIVKQQKVDEHDISYRATVLRADGSPLEALISSVMATTGDAKKFRIITLRPIADTSIMTGPHSAGAHSAGTHSESVGRIKLVGLDEVRAALGDRWPAVAQRAMATAESVIKRHCGTQDSFSRADDTSFLICFGVLSEEEASFRAAMIGREIRNRLIGQGEDPDNAYVRSVAAVVRLPDERGSNASFQATLLNRLDEQLERLERQARQTLTDALASAACDLEPVFGHDASQVVARQVLIPPKIQRQVVSALAILPKKESQAFDLDGLLVGLAAQHAVSGLALGKAMPLLVEISFDIFATRAATERFFAIYSKIDARLSTRLIVLLSSLPEGLPRSRLQDCINRLRPFCRGVGYLVDDVAELSRFDLSNSFNPVVALPAPACIADAAGNLKGLFTSLQSRRAKILVYKVVTDEDAAALRSLGADMITMKRPQAPAQ
jgi:PAS domain S-box-containing protein